MPHENDNSIQQSKFAQIYIFDSKNELQNRIIFRAESAPDPRRHNSPTADEIGELIVSDDDEGSIVSTNRDIILRLRGIGGGLERINELHQHYDPLQHVMIFLFGNLGWNINIRMYSPDMMEIDQSENQIVINKAEISVMQYYSSRLMHRPGNSLNIIKNERVSLHFFGKLFHQYVVDMYAKMEQQRLNFIRFNQKSYRAEVYSGLTDAIRLDENDMTSVGKRAILPSSFIGGLRFMAQLYQDAMNLFRRFGKPDLFITFTCNPA